MSQFMPEIIFSMSVALLILGMFRCEIDSWKDRPYLRMPFSGTVVVMPPEMLYELPPNNMGDCLLKQQLKPENGR